MGTGDLRLDSGGLGMDAGGLGMDPRGLGMDTGAWEEHWESGDGCWGFGDGLQRFGNGHWRCVVRHRGSGDTGGLAWHHPRAVSHRWRGCHPALSPAQAAGFGMLRKTLTWLLVPARRHPRGCGSTSQDFGKDFGACWLAGRQLCLAVPCAPGCAPWSPSLSRQPRTAPGEGLPGCRWSSRIGASHVLRCGSRHGSEVFAPSCCMIPLESQRDHGVWVQDRDEEQEFSSRSCQDF